MASSSSCCNGLDAFWQKASHVVQTGDFDAYVSMYHPDAVLVCTTTRQEGEGEEVLTATISTTATDTGTINHDDDHGTTRPIAQALDGWKAGFDATAAGRQRVTLSLRFSQRLHGSTTAHETGIFCYTSTTTEATTAAAATKTTATTSKEPTTTVVYLHFESLLVKKLNTGWLWMMEFQKQKASEEEWDALEDPFV